MNKELRARLAQGRDWNATRLRDMTNDWDALDIEAHRLVSCLESKTPTYARLVDSVVRLELTQEQVLEALNRRLDKVLELQLKLSAFFAKCANDAREAGLIGR